ncbi:MAG: iron-sulfur cluster assembly accessory protein [Myxococcota bacterium]|jgi:iron-sulfur cluster assembly accessory protein
MMTMTEACAKHLETLAEREAIELVGVRIKVIGGGCSGLSYDIGFESEAGPNDLIFGEHPKLFVDKKSLKFVEGLILDVKSALVGTGFVFRNPNASNTCGCGTSFAV